MNIQTQTKLITPAQIPLMLHKTDLDLVAQSLMRTDFSRQTRAHDVLLTIGRASYVLDCAGAGALALRPIKSLGGAG